MARARLKAGHVQPVWAGHPWVFAQAIADIEGAPGPGDVIRVVDPKGQFLGKGFYSPKSAIPIRILSWDESDPLDAASLTRRIEDAARFRKDLLGLPSAEDNAYRLVHSEGDALSGLIVDVYDRVARVQLLTPGMKRREADLLGAIARVARVDTVLEVPTEKGDDEKREEASLVVRGPEVRALSFRERGFEYELDLETTQKTGYYLDQRENRGHVERLAKGKRVLDAFSYVGAFSLAAARGGASEVVALESSAPAVAAAASHVRRHGYDDRVELRKADVKRAFPEMIAAKERFDVVVLDPPKLIPTARHLERGRAAYRRLNANAMQLVRPGGVLVTCSCSAAMRDADFLRMLSFSARDARRRATRLFLGEQAPDHPVPVSFPEGHYLKAAFLRID